MRDDDDYYRRRAERNDRMLVLFLQYCGLSMVLAAIYWLGVSAGFWH